MKVPQQALWRFLAIWRMDVIHHAIGLEVRGK
jgi:hypothetical protein